jgi:hypothetical protein
MIEKSAKGVRGFLLYDPSTGLRFFRVYGEKDQTGRKSYTDYSLCAEDIEVTVEAKNLSLYEGEEKNRLGWSSNYLLPKV